MRWGIGAHRSGTKSLAVQFGGVHEPKPALHTVVGEPEGGVKKALLDRLQDFGPDGLCVDAEQTWYIPHILEIDPDAEFWIVIRDPIMCITSMVSPENPEHRHRETINEAIYEWLSVYDHIWARARQHPHILIPTESLTVRENTYPDNQHYTLHRNTARVIATQCYRWYYFIQEKMNLWNPDWDMEYA